MVGIRIALLLPRPQQQQHVTDPPGDGYACECLSRIAPKEPELCLCSAIVQDNRCTTDIRHQIGWMMSYGSCIWSREANDTLKLHLRVPRALFQGVHAELAIVNLKTVSINYLAPNATRL